MANKIKVYSVKEKDFWRDLLDSCEDVDKYKIVNNSDYTGVEFSVEWDYK